MTTKTKVLPAGEYYVGDLMYAAEADDWLFEAAWTPDRGAPHFFTSPDGNHHGCAMRTALGDGVFFDQDGDSYCVDSGGLGAIAAEAINPDDREHLAGLGFFITYAEPFSCTYTEEYGICSFGNFHIKTNPENY